MQFFICCMPGEKAAPACSPGKKMLQALGKHVQSGLTELVLYSGDLDLNLVELPRSQMLS